MRSLFLKVFVWFWLAMTLSGVALFLVGLATQTGPPAEHRRRLTEQWRHLTGQTLAVYGGTAVAAFEREGIAGLDRSARRLEEMTGIRITLVLRGTESILDRGASEGARRLAVRAATSGEIEVELPTGETALMAGRVAGAGGAPYIFAGVVPGPRAPEPAGRLRLVVELSRFARGFSVPALVSLVVGALVCLGLAWHLTAPVRRLRVAAQRLASGDLGARLGSAVRGRDETAALARDFDLMAERIEALVTAQRQLLRDISHELRSPLARLSVALELARQRTQVGAGGPLDRIGREAERLNELIGQLLTLTQLEGGGERVTGEPISLRSLVEMIAADAGFEAQARDRKVRATVEEDVVVQGSEELLRRAIENVVRNAVRYTEEHTQVELSLARRAGAAGEEAVVRIRDRGPGVPESALSQLFQPFYRVADARDRQSGGSGIGLAITERAVRLHGGSVAAANAPGGGLVVEIVLPTGTEQA